MSGKIEQNHRMDQHGSRYDDIKDDDESGSCNNLDEENVVIHEKNQNTPSSLVLNIQNTIIKLWNSNREFITKIFLIVLGLLYVAYFIYAMYYRFGDEGSYRLLGYTVFGAILLFIHFCWKYIRSYINDSCTRSNIKPYKALKWFLYLASLTVVISTVIIYVAMVTPVCLVFILLMFITSHNPAKVKWHTVLVSLILQYFFALFILKTDIGNQFFVWLGNRATELLKYSNAGSLFVFGEAYTRHPMAFQVFPVITFFSSMLSVLYYLGIVQKVINGFGRFLGFLLATTPAESICAAGSIFLGQSEAAIIVKPFVSEMTKSEIAAVMISTMSTMMGSILAVCITFGIPARHLLSASVMSAPAALAIAKLTYPETEKTKSSDDDYNVKVMGKERNIIEAISSGASASISLIASVGVNLIAFLALLEFVNICLIWFGQRAGIDGLTFEFISSYVLFPVAYFMGTDVRDCSKVAELLGIKIFTLSINAYIKLAKMMENNEVFTNYTTVYANKTDALWEWRSGDIYLINWNQTLPDGILFSDKSEVIATYALCGFSNFGTLGGVLGLLSALAPERRNDIASVGLRCLIASNVACCLTACIAGLLYEPDV